MDSKIISFLGNGKFHLISDQRTLIPTYPLHDTDYLKEIIRLYPIKCPFLLIMCKKSKSLQFAESAIEEHEKCQNFTLQWVDAGHDVHITDPEMIAPYITQFLMKKQANL